MQDVIQNIINICYLLLINTKQMYFIEMDVNHSSQKKT